MIRATQHNRRIHGRKQTHNDRQFDTTKAKNIDPTMTRLNATQNFYNDPALTFDEVERKFYEQYIGQHLQEQNNRYILSGHRERVKTIDEYRQAKQTCPEETLYYLGKRSDGNRATAKQIMQVYEDFRQWHKQAFPLIVRLNVALHRDEPGSADHIHERKIYLYHTKDGLLSVSQTKCFKEMGVERPDPSKPQSRYNNPKMTYSRICRDKFIEIAENHGIEVETEPQEASETGLLLKEYKRQQEEKRLEELQEQIKETKQRLEQAQERDKYQQRLNRLIYRAINDPIIDNHPSSR